MTSFLDELRDVRRQVLEQATTELPVPVLVSDGTEIVPKWTVRFRPPTTEEKIIPVAAAASAGRGITIAQGSDLIIDCCDEILRFDNLQPVDPDGGPLRFDGGDERWGLTEGKQTAREAVAKLYSLDVHPLAIASTVEQLVLWLQGLETVVKAKVVEEGKGQGVETS